MYLRKKSPRTNENCLPLPLSECYAKTQKTSKGDFILGVDIYTHSVVVGVVARELVGLYPEYLQNRLFPKGTELIAAAHDVGKINPHFQEKLRRATSDYKTNSNSYLQESNPELERSFGFHAGVSYASLQGKGNYLSIIVGSHHGSVPVGVPLEGDHVIGDKSWADLRALFITYMQKYFKVDWPIIENNIQATAIAGLVSVADWIGSGILSNMVDVTGNNIVSIIRSKIQEAGFVVPSIKSCLQFNDLFPPYHPRGMQSEFIRMIDQPGVYILEALMGEGKTEAALNVAYNMVSQKKATGIYFALPTRLTSEKLYDRFNLFLENILSDEEKHKTLLLHGQSWLYETSLGEEGRPGYSWFDSNKRGLLAPFAVGTIDQSLMAVLNVKHSFVRAFGLAGKVVILDEVHTYDAFTGTIMDNLIKTLVSLGCTIILLSATLTAKRKLELIHVLNETAELTNMPQSYPLITKLIPNKNPEYSNSIESTQRTVSVINCHDDAEALDVVREKALQGECILWIENTVQEAQDVFCQLGAWSQENNVDIGLLHSRFPQIRRSELEDTWVTSFGKSGIEHRRTGGRILIGTQILEQSLDIDADFLVTRLAPTDMVLQRVGRLWRHRDIDLVRPNQAKATVLILSPADSQSSSNLERAFGKSGFVYDPYVLLRSQEVWLSQKSVTIPRDLRTLIESTYANRPINSESSAAKNALANLQKEKDKLYRMALNGISQVGVVQQETISTRYGDMPSCGVLMLQSDIDGDTICLWDGTSLHIPEKKVLSEKEKKHIAKTILARIVTVPSYMAPEHNQESDIAWLRPFLYCGKLGEDTTIRVCRLLPSGRIEGLAGKVAHNKYDITYTTVVGYKAKERN